MWYFGVLVYISMVVIKVIIVVLVISNGISGLVCSCVSICLMLLLFGWVLLLFMCVFRGNGNSVEKVLLFFGGIVMYVIMSSVGIYKGKKSLFFCCYLFVWFKVEVGNFVV